MIYLVTAFILLSLAALFLRKEHFLSVYLFFYKWFSTENISFIGIYYKHEIFTLHSKLYYEPHFPLLPDIVFICRHFEHYDLYFLFRLRRYKLTLCRIPVGHALHFDNTDKNDKFIYPISPPYEKHTPFKLKHSHPGAVHLYKKEKRGFSFTYVRKDSGRKWPLTENLDNSAEITNS